MFTVGCSHTKEDLLLSNERNPNEVQIYPLASKSHRVLFRFPSHLAPVFPSSCIRYCFSL